MAGAAIPRTTFPGYVDPVPKNVTPERIDMGVDYAGSGNYLAIGDGVVTQVNPGGWGRYGNYIAYKLTSGPLAGREIYYAEGVTPHVKVGQKLSAGQIVASIIPGWQYGTEIGYGSGQQNTAAAASYYTEGARTAAGQAFSDLIAKLGGPPGLAEGRPVTGSAPALGVPAGTTGSGTITRGGAAASGGSGLLPNISLPDLNPVDAVKGALDDLFTSIVSKAKYAALALVLIVGGFVLLGKGASRATHAGEGAP